jgi:hypothetical protein
VLTLRAERNLPDFESGQDTHDDGLGHYAITARTSFRIFERMVIRAEEVREAIP